MLERMSISGPAGVSQPPNASRPYRQGRVFYPLHITYYTCTCTHRHAHLQTHKDTHTYTHKHVEHVFSPFVPVVLMIALHHPPPPKVDPPQTRGGSNHPQTTTLIKLWCVFWDILLTLHSGFFNTLSFSSLRMNDTPDGEGNIYFSFFSQRVDHFIPSVRALSRAGLSLSDRRDEAMAFNLFVTD